MIARELLVLRRVREGRIRFQKPIHQPAFLFLRNGGGNADEQCPDGKDHPHVCERAEADARL